jgi:hypothetical protein
MLLGLQRIAHLPTRPNLDQTEQERGRSKRITPLRILRDEIPDSLQPGVPLDRDRVELGGIATDASAISQLLRVAGYRVVTVKLYVTRHRRAIVA